MFNHFSKGKICAINNYINYRQYNKIKIRGTLCFTLGVVTASPEAVTLRAKLDMACFCWVSLIVEGRNILHMRKLCRAKSFAPEMKNKHVERFMCKSFYLLLYFLSPLLVFSDTLELLFLSSSWSSV